MFRHFSRVRAILTSSPLATNCLVYGSISGMAEFSQQTLVYKVFPEENKRQKYNVASIFRYTVLGGAVFSPTLHFWYRWLDRCLPGTAVTTVVKKVVIDVGLFAIPYYTVFYVLINVMAGESIQVAWDELKKKLFPTMAATAVFWVPAQIVNFRLVPPRLRVVYMALCTFVEFNILAVFKKWDGKSIFV